MNVLVIGTGGREHALALALARDPGVTEVHVAPGNPGIGRGRHAARRRPARRRRGRRRWPASSAPTWSSSGRRRRWWPASPTPCAARASPASARPARPRSSRGRKAFAKDVMAAAGVPTARARVCTTPERGRGRARRVRPAVRRQGRRPRRRQGRRRHRRPRRRRSPTRPPASGWSIEEYLDGPEVSLFASPTARPSSRCSRRRTSSGSATATPAPTPAAWAPTRRCPGRPPDLVDEVTAHGPAADRRRDGPARHPVRRAAVRRARADLARAPGGRVQRPLRRPGDPAVLALLDSPLGALLLGAPRPARWPTSTAAAVARRRRRHGVMAAAGYPRPPRTGDVIVGHRDARRRRRRVHVHPRRHRDAVDGRRWSPPAAGCWRSPRLGADLGATPARQAYAGVAHDPLRRRASGARDIAAGRSAGADRRVARAS